MPPKKGTLIGPVGSRKPCTRCLAQIAWGVKLAADFANHSHFHDKRVRRWKINLCPVCMEELEKQLELFVQRFVSEGDAPDIITDNGKDG